MGRGAVWVGAVGVGVGELLLLSGVALFFTQQDKGGCGARWSSNEEGCSVAKVGLIGGAALGALAGSYWLFYYRGDSARVSVAREF